MSQPNPDPTMPEPASLEAAGRESRTKEPLRRPRVDLRPLAVLTLGGAALVGWQSALPTRGVHGADPPRQSEMPWPALQSAPTPMANLPLAPAGKAAEPVRPFFIGPPVPPGLPRYVGPPVPDGLLARQGASQPGGGDRRGRIGPMGPVSGPLSTSLPLAAAGRGPIWDGAPLPNPELLTLPGAPPARAASTPAALAERHPARTTDSSELPDMQTVTLSRLANPEVQVRGVEPRKAGTVSAREPLALHLSVGKPGQGAHVGDTVAVRMSASTACYLTLIRVDAAGKGSVLLSPTGPSRHFACVLRAGPVSGAEYLLAVASVNPLSGSEVATALRASGARFPSPTGAPEGSMEPGTAWSQALAAASGIGGSGKGAAWERFEWDVATASFGALPALRVASARPGITAKPAARPDAGKEPEPKRPAVSPAAPKDQSLLPGGEKAEPPTAQPASPKEGAARPAEPSTLPATPTAPPVEKEKDAGKGATE